MQKQEVSSMEMKEVINFADVMANAIENNILTNTALKENSLYNEYWLACHDLAKALVRANYPKTEMTRHFMSWDYEDVVSELSILLVAKFETQIKAILNPKVDNNGNYKKHNFGAYTAAILSNLLIDRADVYARKKTVKYVDANGKMHRKTVNVKKTDENGKKHNVYWNFDSMSRPISDDGSLTLGDTLPSNAYNPEDLAIAKSEEMIRNAETFDHLKKMCKMKTYLGCVYVYIEDYLIQSSIPCSLDAMLMIFNNIESKSPAYQAAAKKALVRAYNHDLVSFVNLISENEINDEGTNFIFTNYAKAFSDFGRDFHVDDDSIYHRRDEYKKTLAIIQGLEIPKKYKKNLHK